jgi:hypothetical protein
MKALTSFLAAAVLLAASSHTSTATAQEGKSAKELASQLSANLTDGTAFIRLRMKTGGSTLQLQVKERRTRAGSDILYQVLYPKERKGEAVLLQSRGGKISGKTSAPGGTVQNIGSMKGALFGSALSYEDVIENFFAWDQQAIVGTEEVKNVNCQILESKSGSSRVRSWIDTKRMIPMRVEKYSGSNLVRRIDTTRIAEDDTDRRIPASVNVQHGGVTTEIEGSSTKSGVALSEADFSPQGMANLAPPK